MGRVRTGSLLRGGAPDSQLPFSGRIVIDGQFEASSPFGGSLRSLVATRKELIAALATTLETCTAHAAIIAAEHYENRTRRQETKELFGLL